ncbi:MAG TPA: FtsX-like permease family protein, partial [Thermoanaerobaculia bacterium]|nr:FtsX-like permease family protein [Thermoanaerobaculia bacterium]
NFFGQLSCDPEIFFSKIFDDATIDPAVEKEFREKQNTFVAGQSLVDKFHWKKGDHISLRGTYIPVTLDLVFAGPYHSGDESNIFFHNEYLNQAKWFGANRFTGIYYLKVANGSDLPRVTAAIDKMFENSDAPTKTMTEKQFQASFMEMMGNIKGLIRWISLIILFAVTLIVANTVAMSARERVTEISVMRTLGFRPGHILGFILSESVLMSLLGGSVGVVLAKFVLVPGMVKGMATTPMAPFLINFKVNSLVLVAAFAISVAIGVLAGFVPAIRSSRIRIVDGLRQVV